MDNELADAAGAHPDDGVGEPVTDGAVIGLSIALARASAQLGILRPLCFGLGMALTVTIAYGTMLTLRPPVVHVAALPVEAPAVADTPLDRPAGGVGAWTVDAVSDALRDGGWKIRAAAELRFTQAGWVAFEAAGREAAIGSEHDQVAGPATVEDAGAPDGVRTWKVSVPVRRWRLAADGSLRAPLATAHAVVVRRPESEDASGLALSSLTLD